MLLGSLLLLLVAAAVESMLHKHLSQQYSPDDLSTSTSRYYPLKGMIACWVFAMLLMFLHLWFAFGGKEVYHV